MRCYSEPYDLSSAMPHDQQTIEQAERDCRHDEQIHRGDAVGMIAEERLPPLGRRTSSLGHIFGHAGLSDRDAHLADQSAYFQRNCWPATLRSRLPVPVETEARTVPFDYGPGPDNRKRIKNAREEAIPIGRWHRRIVSWGWFVAEQLSAAATSRSLPRSLLATETDRQPPKQ